MKNIVFHIFFVVFAMSSTTSFSKPLFNKYSYLDTQDKTNYCANISHEVYKKGVSKKKKSLKPIVCVVQITANVNPKRPVSENQFPTKELIVKFQPKEIMKLCFNFKDQLNKGEFITGKKEIVTYCSTEESAKRVFKYNEKTDLVTNKNNRTIANLPSNL